jgi:hypothetical protein
MHERNATTMRAAMDLIFGGPMDSELEVAGCALSDDDGETGQTFLIARLDEPLPPAFVRRLQRRLERLVEEEFDVDPEDWEAEDRSG